MPAFPITIDVPESSNPQDLGFTDQLGSAEGQSKSSVQNTVPVQQPQDSQEATERDDTDAEEPAFEIRSSPNATPSFRGRFFRSPLPAATPSAAILSVPRGGVLSNALTEGASGEGPEAASKETATTLLQPVLRKAVLRRSRDRSQNRRQLPYQQAGYIHSPVNLITQQEASSMVPSHKPVQLHDRLINSYGRCPPPPHSGKGWIDHCLSKEYNEASIKFAPPPVKGLGAGIGLWEHSFLVFGVLICLAGIILWLYGLIHSIQYIRKNYATPQHTRQYQRRSLLPQIYGRKFSKSRSRKGISEGWRNDGQKNGEVIWPEEEQENAFLMTNNYPYYDEESTMDEKSLSDTEKDYESRYGKSMERVLLDGLVGSMKGGTWLRRVLGSSWRGAITVQSTRHPTFGGPSTEQQQPFTDGNARDPVGGYSDTLGHMELSDSFRSASGVDMNWERGEVTLSFRRDALLRRAMRADKSRMGSGDLGVHARSAASSIRGAEAYHIPARIHDT